MTPTAQPRRAIRVFRRGDWPEAEALDDVVLDFDHRHRRRLLLRTQGGGEVLLDLPEVARLAEGDGLMLEGGGWIRVRAAPEAVLEVRAAPLTLLRIAWHLGNRHVPVEIVAENLLRIRNDHVLAEMIASLGGHAMPAEKPFTPEAGAYAAGHHPHAHAHGHAPPQAGEEAGEGHAHP